MWSHVILSRNDDVTVHSASKSRQIAVSLCDHLPRSYESEPVHENTHKIPEHTARSGGQRNPKASSRFDIQNVNFNPLMLLHYSQWFYPLCAEYFPPSQTERVLNGAGYFFKTPVNINMRVSRQLTSRMLVHHACGPNAGINITGTPPGFKRVSCLVWRFGLNVICVVPFTILNSTCLVHYQVVICV
jgi:hypothetical protein